MLKMDKYLQSLQINLHWLHSWLCRRVFGQNRPAMLEDVKILYKSTNFIVVDKHYDVKINSDDSKDKITVATQLAHQFPELVDASIGHQFRFVHRLDYSTSGTLCVALNKKASADAMVKFKKHLVTKCYYALVRGHIQEDYLRIDKPVYPNPSEGFTHMMCVADDIHSLHSSVASIRCAATELYVVQRGLYDGQPASKVLLKPLTGRRHQLRVHCWSLGHPIVGDFTYSFRRDVKPYRMMLHSHRLTIPTKAETVDVVAPDPFLPEVDPKWCPFDDSEISQEECGGIVSRQSSEMTENETEQIDGIRDTTDCQMENEKRKR